MGEMMAHFRGHSASSPAISTANNSALSTSGSEADHIDPRMRHLSLI